MKINHIRYSPVLFILFFGQIGFAQIDTVAVAPFNVIGEFKNEEIYSYGFPEAIANDLSNISGLMVVERLKLSEVLQELKLVQAGLIGEKDAPKLGEMVRARMVVIGTIQKMGEVVHVNTRIVNVSSGETMLSVEAERTIKTFQDVFRLQDIVAKRIILQLRLKVTRETFEKIEKDATGSEEAFKLFSIGIRFQDWGQYQKSMECFRKSSEIDPNFYWVQQVRMRAEAAFEELEKETEKDSTPKITE